MSHQVAFGRKTRVKICEILSLLACFLLCNIKLKVYFHVPLFRSHLSDLFGLFYILNTLLVVSSCFLILDLAMPVTYLAGNFDTLQTSQGTSVHPLHNLKERSCWILIQEALVWVRRVRMSLWGKGRVENHWGRGDCNFSQPLPASQHRRKSLHTLGWTTAHSHAPAQTPRQANRQDRVLLALIKELARCNLVLCN